jgi:cyclophilin family peptidyl-prolyl cis-trans isomerase
MRSAQSIARNFALALLLAGCAPPPPPPVAPTPPPPPPPVVIPPKPTWSAADIDTMAEVMRLEDRREFDAVRFAAWLRSPVGQVRRRAVVGAGRIGDARAAELIISMLSDSAADVRADAAFALGELNDTSALVVQALTNTAQGNDSAGVEAINSLGRLAASSGCSVIERRIGSANTPADVLREALLALPRFPRQPHTLDLILPNTRSPEIETRRRAVYALTRGTTDPRAVPDLLRLLQDTDALVRALAARGLRAATADSASQRTPIADSLRRALADTHPHVRINAARSLATFRDPANIAALAALLHDADGNVVVAAAEALAENGGAAAQLEQAIRSDSRIGIRNTALNMLLRADRERALQIANEWIDSPEWLTRLYGLRVLIASRSSDVRERVRARISDPDARVAAVALQSVAATDTANPPYTLYIEKLAHRDPGVRAAAIRGLQRRASPSDLEALLRAYDRAQQDTQRSAITAAIDALGTLAEKGVPVQRSFFLRFKKPSDPLLLQRIQQRLGPNGWGPIRPIETGKSIQDYRAIAHRYLHPDSTEVAPRVRIRTAAGEIILKLEPQEAPLTVSNFLTLAQRGYFNNSRWHRVVPNFVLQDGDTRGDGGGSPGWVIRDEINRLRYERGSLGMALSGPDTGGSQFFITHAPQPHLDGGYTIFGRVIEGMDVADRVAIDDAILSIEVIR